MRGVRVAVILAGLAELNGQYCDADHSNRNSVGLLTLPVVTFVVLMLARAAWGGRWSVAERTTPGSAEWLSKVNQDGQLFRQIGI